MKSQLKTVSAPLTGEKQQHPSRLLQVVADLFPGYFALVMATGIISIAAQLVEMRTVALTLLVVNLIAYTVLWLLLLLRLILFFSRIRKDIADHVRGPGFFTVVAGTCVLGSQLILVVGRYEAALFSGWRGFCCGSLSCTRFSPL